MTSRLSGAMVAVLASIAHGRDPFTGIVGAARRSAAKATLEALLRRELIAPRQTGGYLPTPAGLEALAAVRASILKRRRAARWF